LENQSNVQSQVFVKTNLDAFALALERYRQQHPHLYKPKKLAAGSRKKHHKNAILQKM
jgi:hypothetical protein